MSVSPLNLRPRALAPQPTTDWSLDLLPSGGTSPAAANTNVAKINGQNIRYTGPGRQYDVDISYLQADLLDMTPNDPLTIWEFGTYKVKVQAGQVKLSDEQANKIIASQLWGRGPDFPVKKASVEFLPNNQLKLKGAYHWGFLPIPLSLKASVATPTATTVKVAPNSVRVFGLPVFWAIKLFNVDVAKHMPANDMAKMGADRAVTLDLTKTALFEGKLNRIDISSGKAVVTIGGQPAPSLAGSRTGGKANYAEIIAQGEVALESAIIRNATVMTIDDTPEDPYSFNLWDTEGYARVERGDVILDEVRLAKKFASAGEGFIVKEAKLKGNDLVVDGTYEFIGLPFPLDFKLNFSRTANGKLKLTPHDVRVVGFNAGRDSLMEAMAKVPGMIKDGDGFILDLRASASVEMPNIRTVRSEPGRIVLTP